MEFKIKSKKDLVKNQSVEEQSNWLSEVDNVSDIKADRINGGGGFDTDRINYQESGWYR